MFPGFGGKCKSDENTSRGDYKDNSPRSISDKSIQASKNKGTKQSSDTAGGSQEVVSDGAVGHEVVQYTMSPKNVPTPDAGSGVIDKAPDQKKAEKPDDDPKSQS